MDAYGLSGCVGNFGSPRFFVNFFLFSAKLNILPLETTQLIVYNSKVYAYIAITNQTMRGIDHMSASSKKKLRKEQEAAALTEKQLAE